MEKSITLWRVRKVLDLDTLLDYVQDDCTITIFDCDKGEDIEKGLTIDEARQWAYEHACDLCSFEPTPKVNEWDFGITINVSDVEDND